MQFLLQTSVLIAIICAYPTPKNLSSTSDYNGTTTDPATTMVIGTSTDTFAKNVRLVKQLR